MKTFLTIILSLTTANTWATIEGPSCQELTRAQGRLLRNAAIHHIAENKSANASNESIAAVSVDCHDYDGVHSVSEFTVQWILIDEDRQMKCTQNLGVSVDYDAEKGEKFINEYSFFNVEEYSEVQCVDWL